MDSYSQAMGKRWVNAQHNLARQIFIRELPYKWINFEAFLKIAASLNKSFEKLLQ